MLTIEKQIQLVLSDIVNKLYADKELKEIDIIVATNEKFGDFQSNFAMMNSKIIGENPRSIAENVVKNLPEGTIIEKIEVAGPGFLNIFLKDSYLADIVKKISKEKYEFPDLNTKGDVIIDYSSPNIAKRMHIGHLRSTIIGDSVKRMYQYLGYHVVADNHIGDWGTQFGKLIIGYRNWLNREAYKANPIEELERVYVEFAKQSEENPKLEEEAREELKKLQNGDGENYRLWQEFIDESLNEYNKIYNRMGIEFDTYHGESFYHNLMPGVVEELLDKGIAVEDQGAKVVFFPESDKLNPCIVQKKDGAFLYATSDIATVKFRMQNYDVNKIIYVTDERQQDHFKQFFRITEMMGWNIEKQHIWFGIMRFADGVFSTRKGNVIRLEELLDEGHRRAYEIVNEKNPQLPEKEKQSIAEAVGVGAIKYADLSQNRQTAVIFEWDKILSFEGNTAPYLQYSYARIKSILRKAKEQNKDICEDTTIKFVDKTERMLAYYLLLFPEVVIKAAQSCRPNLVADYLFELSKKFNSFYNACPILNQEDELLYSRLLLSERTATVLKQGLNILGIETLERM